MKIKKVYVAGLLTPRGVWSKNLAIDHLINQRKMIRYALDVFFAGYDPFVPAFDHKFWMVMDDDEFITEAMIKRYSKTWLEACDAMVLTPGWQKSTGTLIEIKHAEEREIPVFKSLEELKVYSEREDKEDAGAGI